MSQHINPTPKQTDITSLNSKLIPQRLTVTLLSGFSFKSWGHAEAYRVGNIVIVSITGLICSTSISTETPFLTISGLNPVAYIMAVGRCGSTPMAVAAHANENKIYMNDATANENCFGEIVIPVNN